MRLYPNYKISEDQKKEFSQYLQKTGVLDALTKTLVSLFEEPDKPENAVKYICNNLARQVRGETLDSLESQLEEIENEVIELQTAMSAKKSEEAPTETDASSTKEKAAPPAA